MADKKISELDAITGANTAADDLFLIVDSSGSVTKKITRAELNNAIEQDVLSTVDINGGTIDSTVIGGATPAAGDFTTLGATGNITVGGTVDGRDVAADGTKLDGIEASATADQTAAEIRTLVESATDSNVFTDADHTKLNGIEASADVTDATNVAAAGAAMLTGATFTGTSTFGTSSADTRFNFDGPNQYRAVFKSSGTIGGQIGAAGADDLRFSNAAGSTVASIKDGNLLVGKTADNVATVGIEARGTGPLISTRDGGDALRLNRLNSDGEIIQLRKDGTTVGSIKAGNGDLLIGTGAVNLRFFDATPAVIPRTASDGTSTGVVDLGNTSNKFKDGYFAGNIRTDSTLFAPSLTCYPNGSTPNADAAIYRPQDGTLGFVSNGSERARIDSSGNHNFNYTGFDAGLGNTTTGVSIRADNIVAISSASGYVSVNRNSDGTVQQFNRSGNTKGTITINSSGTTYNTTSDIRLKQDIEPLVATDKLMAMNPVSYNWKADPDGPRSMGFIAQEMEEVMPEAVSTGDDDMMSMDYGRITPILVSALQDAHRKIEELAAEIAELKAN